MPRAELRPGGDPPRPRQRGKLTARLIEKIILPAFRNPALERLDDQAILPFAAPGWPSPPTPTFGDAHLFPGR